MRRKKLLLIYSHYSTFVKTDYEILSHHYEVECYRFKASKKLIPFTYEMMRLFLFIIIRGWSFQFFFIWFADYYSFFPTLFASLTGKKSFIVSGGFDAVSIPSIKYGLFHKKDMRSLFGKLSYQFCTKIFPVDPSLIENFNNYSSDITIQSGILSFCRIDRNKFKVIPTGYDPNVWKANQSVSRINSVVSVGSVSNDMRWKLKGGAFLMSLASHLPEINFSYWGVQPEYKLKLQQQGIPPNFHVMGFVDSNQLPEVYSKHKVYAQFSLSEGLPNVLCEAMLCGCIPVGSKVNGIPNAIGDTGFILEHDDIDRACQLIRQALQGNDTGSPRKRIIELFSIEKREQTLINAIGSSI